MTPTGHRDQPDPAAEPGEHGLVSPAAHPHTGAAGAEGLPGAQFVPTLKLAEIIMAVVDCRHRLPLAASVALVREPRGESTLLRVVFLDGKNEPVPADADVVMTTTYVAGRLDDDLAAAFGDKNVIVLKLESPTRVPPGHLPGHRPPWASARPSASPVLPRRLCAIRGG